MLAQRIRDEVAQLDRSVATASRHWQRSLSTDLDQDAYLNSVAFSLHSFYTGVEHMLELVAQEMDGGTLGGETWHTELLHQMALDVPAVRPAVLGHKSAEWLDEYRKFRHRVRNIYATNLLPERLQSLVEGLPTGWACLREDLLAFAGFLERL